MADLIAILVESLFAPVADVAMAAIRALLAAVQLIGDLTIYLFSLSRRSEGSPARRAIAGLACCLAIGLLLSLILSFCRPWQAAPPIAGIPPNPTGKPQISITVRIENRPRSPALPPADQEENARSEPAINEPNGGDKGKGVGSRVRKILDGARHRFGRREQIEEPESMPKE